MIPAFHHTLLKEPLEVDLKWNSLKWNWLLFKNSFRWSKGLLYKKGEKFFVWSFSRCRKILFSKWIISLFLSYWRFKASCSDVWFSVPNFVRLTSVFEDLFIWETRRGKKARADDKTEKENLFHRFFIEVLLEHVTETCYWSKWNMSIWHPSRQRKQSSIFCKYPSFL